MDTADISKTLYKYNSNQKLLQWNIDVVTKDSKVYIISEYGQVNGKIQHREKEVTEAKSKDTLENQAVFEAKRKWLDKVIKEKYSTDTPNVQEDKKDETLKEFIPMLAQTYKKKKGFETPCIIQPKLDGVRAYFDKSKGTFRSRNHKEYFNMDHLTEHLSSIPDNVIFDGELYNHDMSFQELMKYVKLKEIKEDDTVDMEDGDGEDEKSMLDEIKKCVKYHIFDCYFPDKPDMPFSERYQYLESLEFSKTDIYLVEIQEMTDIANINTIHDYYSEQKYEGIMLRTPESPYEFKRSKFLQKYKIFVDEEFEVIGFDKEVQGKKHLVLWVCKTVEDKEFTCRPTGTHKDRAELYKRASDYIGKKLTVEFQEYTDDKIPRFPVGKGFRDDI